MESQEGWVLSSSFWPVSRLLPGGGGVEDSQAWSRCRLPGIATFNKRVWNTQYMRVAGHLSEVVPALRNLLIPVWN